MKNPEQISEHFKQQRHPVTSNNSKKLALLHQNCQSLTNKVTELEILLAECESDIVCLSEHWYQNNTILGVNLENYRILDYFSRSQFKQGGTAIFGKLGISGEPIEKIKDLCVELHFECSAVRFNHPNFGKFIVAALYRSSSHGNVDIFIDKLISLLDILSKFQGYSIILTGQLWNNVLMSILPQTFFTI